MSTEAQNAAAPAAAEDDPQQPGDQVEQQDPAQATGAESPTEQKDEKRVQELPERALRRINKITADKYAYKAKAEALERELSELRAARQAQADADGDQRGAADRQQPREEPEVIARRMVEQQRFNDRSDDALRLGRKEFSDFEQRIAQLGAVGNEDPRERYEFMQAVVDCDNPHKVLYHLATNLDEAERIMSLSGRAQARALGRLEVELSAKTIAPPPAAPAPITPVRGAATTAGNSLDDSLPPSEWRKRFNAQYRPR